MLLKLKFWAKKYLKQRSGLWYFLKHCYNYVNKLKRIKWSLGSLPDFVIIGAQKSGTSALYNYMIQHPSIVAPVAKEVHYFDRNFHESLSWYKSFFPSSIYKKLAKFLSGKNIITGEATPEYIFFPTVPERVHNVLPDAKIIVMLRNPVDRAYSQYRMKLRKGKESMEFEEAIDKEEERLKEDKQKMKRDKYYVGENYRHHSYLERGKYSEQLERWLAHYPKEQIHIIKSENSVANPKKEVKKVFKFLGIKEDIDLIDPQVNPSKYPEMKRKTKKKLQKYFKPYNKKLRDLLGTDFKWD